MYMSWMHDGRALWRLGCAFEVERWAGEQAGRPEGGRLERVLAATGAVRGLRAGGGRGQLVMLVRGAEEADAANRGLAVVDVAVRQLPRLRLGDLLRRLVTSAASAPPVPGSSS